ncbi:hypothetical protein ACFU9B_40290 [Streptomyces sp. NPDC057592]|uniref:hypothetical protein n=1 Tax=unclassified Streptomyces TaxID=2593676 RepID=UPI00369E08F1
MRSSLTITLATYLFVSQVRIDLADLEQPLKAIHETADRLGPEGEAVALSETAHEYGKHPEFAAARMRRCLQAVESIQADLLPLPRTAVSL